MRGSVRGRSDDEGFTLVELLSVIIIIGILAGILLPNLLNKRQRAYQASLERTLKDAATAQEAWSVDAGTYTTDVDNLVGEGFKKTAEVELSVELIPGGYCIEATRPGNERPLYMTNAGPSAGKPTPVACGAA